MWTLVLFDLPTTTAFLRKVYGKFRKDLLCLGFEMLQKSVYLRWEDSDIAAQTLQKRVQDVLPQDGQVTILPLTQRAWQNVCVMVDGSPRMPREKPQDFLLFG